ncbi:MAG: acyl-CoA thioesterase [Acidobacteriota bacterium]
MISGRCEVRVRFSDTDAMAVAHHSRHLAWFEVGRTELMRAAGAVYAQLARDGLHLPLIAAGLTYTAPARYDDLLSIETRVTRRSGVRVTFAYRIARADDGADLATGWTEHVLVDARFQPVRFPPHLKDLLDGESSYVASTVAC